MVGPPSDLAAPTPVVMKGGPRLLQDACPRAVFRKKPSCPSAYAYRKSWKSYMGLPAPRPRSVWTQLTDLFEPGRDWRQWPFGHPRPSSECATGPAARACRAGPFSGPARRSPGRIGHHIYYRSVFRRHNRHNRTQGRGPDRLLPAPFDVVQRPRERAQSP